MPAGDVADNEKEIEDDQWTRKVELELVPHPNLERPDPVVLGYDYDENQVKWVKVALQ